MALGKESPVPLDWKFGIETQAGEEAGFDGMLAPVSDGFLALLADGVRMKPTRYRRVDQQWQRTFLEDGEATHVVTLRSRLVQGQNTVAYLRSTAHTTPQLFLASLSQTKLESPKQITDLNPGWKDKPKARVEIVHWRGAREEDVEGLLYYPYAYKADQRHSLVLVIPDLLT